MINHSSKTSLEQAVNTCDEPLLETDIENESNSNVTRFDGKASWFVCVCCVLANIIVIGCLYTYGIFFPYLLKEFQLGKTRTAIVASIQMCAYLMLCPIAVRISIGLGCRLTIIVGGMVTALGFLGSSFAPNLYVLYFTHGIANGFSASLVYMAGLEILPLYFEKQRHTATCFLTVGPGAGVLVMSPTIQALIDGLGWRGAMQALAGISVIACLLGCTVGRRKKNVNKRSSQDNKGLCEFLRSIADVALLKDPKFMLLAIAGVVGLIGDQLPYVHLAKYSAEIGIPGHRSSWFYFTIGVTSSVFRLVTGKILDCGVPALRLYQISNIVYACVIGIVPLVNNYSMLLAYSLTNGVCFGMVASSINCLIAMNYGGTGLGWFYCLQSSGGFIAPTLAGFISEENGSYSPVFYTSASILAICVIISQLSNCVKTKTDKALSSREELVIIEKETVV